MPARLLTPSSIWNSFANSNKRHLIITGGRGTGKTTLLGALFQNSLTCGITTYAEPKKAVYLRENGTTNEITIGIYDKTLPGKENKMRPCAEAFASIGTTLLEKLSQCAEEWISIDEIGYLETACPEYCNAIESLMERKQVVAVVRKQALPFLESLCKRNDVFLVDLDNPFGHVSCVIMASGMGNRFGGNKLMADFHGKPMILRAIEATEGIFEKRVVVTRHEDVVTLCRTHGVENLLHDLPYRSDTVRLGMEAVGNTEACVFCPGDQPLLRHETVAALALAAKNNPDEIWRVSFEGTPGAPVLFPKWTFEELSCLPQGKGGGFLAKKYPERVHTVSAQDKFELMDTDTPEDLAFLLKQKKES
jgi:molybdenum cofactor cytidylyltransferase